MTSATSDEWGDYNDSHEKDVAAGDHSRPSLSTSHGDRPSRAEDDGMGVQKCEQAHKSFKPLGFAAPLGLAEALNSGIPATPNRRGIRALGIRNQAVLNPGS